MDVPAQFLRGGESRRDIDTHMGVPAGRVEVIPVGIDPDEFRPGDHPRDPDSILVITSAESFIDKVASRSNASGYPYLVRCGNDPAMESGAWFREALLRFRNAEARVDR